ncbi:MAG: DUF1273 domain-containing protein [Clostridiales bacterium]|nr:DUF1273 domain-containing protein [Clostridiales bacterium]
MKNYDKTCCFTGHRGIPNKLKPIVTKELEKEVTKLIHDGYLYFGTGGALGFDTLAAKTIIKLRKKNPQIKLILVLPCKTQSMLWSIENKAIYEQIKLEADKIVYISENYTDDCMLERNRHLVNSSSVCIAYLTKSSGGTAYTVEYAKSCKCDVINIAAHII